MATKFVKWDVCPLENLQGCMAYRLRTKVNNNEKLTRKEKNWITKEVNRNSYFRYDIPVAGWMFDFSDVLTTFLVNQYGQWHEYKAMDGIKGLLGWQNYSDCKNLRLTSMRTFREQNPVTKKWYYSDQCIFKDENDKTIQVFDRQTEMWVDISPETIGYSTGLKDKNNSEIYEGDILFCLQNHMNMFKEPTLVKKDNICSYGISFSEVVGNIYDNPELMDVNNIIARL